MKTNKEFEKLLKRVQEENKYKRINIRVRKTKIGYSAFLDYYRRNKHEYYFFSNAQKLTGQRELIQEDIELMDFIRQFRDTKERELKENPENFVLNFESKDADFVAYFEEIKNQKKRPQYQGALKHLKEFLKNKSIRFSELNPRFFEKFRDYLLTQMSNNTALVYLDVLRAALNIAIKDKIIKINPMGDVRLKEEQTEIEFLNDAEINEILKLDTKHKDVKNGFLFSCFTGLRLSDMMSLTYDRIKDGNVYFRQQKTNKWEFLPLSTDAQMIIDEQKKEYPNSEKVFNINSKTNLQKKLKLILADAGIKKSIHYHCSRHSFALRLLNNGVGIYQVSKLLGHSDVKITQVYLKFVPEEKKREIDKLPSLMKPSQ